MRDKCTPQVFYCCNYYKIFALNFPGKPTILRPPPPMLNLQSGDLFVVTCTAVGIPVPEVVWRLNWGHIPDKCSYVSDNGNGTLTCPDIQIEDQGAYSCEAINIRGSVFAVPDTILTVIDNKPNVCPRGYFNEEARDPRECISCFCFGHTSDCRSADLFIYQVGTFEQLRSCGSVT